MKVIQQSVKILSPVDAQQAQRGIKLMEYCGRNCYRSQDRIKEDSCNAFIKSLMDRHHESPLEFFDITVELVTSRDVMAELTRHRLASFAIQSQRYVMEDSDEGVTVIAPLWYKHIDCEPCYPNDLDSTIWENAMINAEKSYKALIMAGKNKEDARKVLSNSTATVICMKANIREWLHILELRTSKAAYPEMRILARIIQAKFAEIMPSIFGGEGVEQ